MAKCHMFFLFLILTLAGAIIQGSHTDAVNYILKNTATTTTSSVRFNCEIGENYTKQTLTSATDFIWTIFQQYKATDRKNVTNVTLFIDSMDGVAYAIDNEIHVNTHYIGNYSEDVKREITGVLYHKMAHIWQWHGNGEVLGGLREGIADFVRLKANYAPSHWVQPGQGEKWDAGYDVTAKFLDYLNGLRTGVVAELNKKMRIRYSDDFFTDLMGKTVDQLWIQYKAYYNGTG